MFHLSRDGEIARLTLDRPEARNAIPAAGWAELAGLLGTVEGRLLIVSGAGGAFCAGADLADFLAFQADEAARARFRADMRAALDTLRDLPMPTIARIDGDCYGAGVSLAMACDLRIAGPFAFFGITPAKIGIAFPQEDAHRLVALVGPGQAARLLFTAITIGGDEAKRIGLVEYDHGSDWEAVDAIIANHDESLATLKQVLAAAAGGVRSDPEQDRRFDALLGGDEMARRLEALRRK